MRVIFEVKNDQAREQLLEHDSVAYWSKADDQLVTWNVYNVGTSIGGGIHLHKNDEEDIIYPDIHDMRVARVIPPIQIVGVLDESEIDVVLDKLSVSARMDNSEVYSIHE